MLTKTSLTIRLHPGDDVVIALLSGNGFHPLNVDPSTAMIGSLHLTDRGGSGRLFYELGDVNGDGEQDLLLHFDRAALLGAGLISPSTTELVVLADQRDGSQVEAHATVRTVQQQ